MQGSSDMQYSNGLIVKDHTSAQWANRLHMAYYDFVVRVVRNLSFARGYTSLLDIGAGDSQIVAKLNGYYSDTWAVDIEQTPSGAQTNVKADFLAWEVGRKFDCIMCLQMLEHVPNPRDFIARMLGMLSKGGSIIITVPYMWEAGIEPQHMQDPVDFQKIVSWLPSGIVPNESHIISEGADPFRRIAIIINDNLLEDALRPLTRKLA